MKEIPLSNGGVVIVDDEDYEWLSQWKWLRGTTGYAVRTVYREPLNGKIRRGIVKMHRVIMAAPPKKIVDHVNRDPLDNRRVNLRFATPRQNCCNRKLQPSNSSGYRGVHWHKGAKKWMACISLDNKSVYLGLFSNKEDAARERDKAARRLYGDFAILNLV